MSRSPGLEGRHDLQAQAAGLRGDGDLVAL